MGVATRNGKKAFFSYAYRPGAMNYQSCMAKNGKATNRAVNNDTLI